MDLSTTEIETLKYPTGKFVAKKEYTFEEIKENIQRLSVLPVALMKLSAEIKAEEMQYCYRPGSWTIAQIFHHIADSHVNAYIRLKFTLAEENPTIKPYNENVWAVMPDANSGDDIHVSVIIVSGIHHRMCKLMESMEEAAFQRTYFHPEHQKTFTLAEMCALYAWHGEHHLAQIKVALEKKF